MRTVLAFVASFTGLLGCGSSVVATSEAASGTGPSSSSATASSASSSSSSTGAGGGGGCSGYIDVAADNGAPVHYASICDQSWGSTESTTAIGFQFSGGPAPGTTAMILWGCVSNAPNAEGIQVSATGAAMPGTFAMGTTRWVDPMGSAWGAVGDPFMLTATKVEPAGGVIEGSFNVTVTHGGNAAHSLSGSFHVCHVNDENAP